MDQKLDKIVFNVKKVPRERRPEHIVLWLLRFSMFVVGIFALAFGDWENFFMSLLAFVLSFIPELVRSRYKLVLPLELQGFIVLLIYFSVFLGETVDIYERVWWWDGMLHVASGVVLGFSGYLILHILYRQGKFRAGPHITALFVFAFGMLLGSLWEIFEFAMDSIFGLFMQKGSLRDTMWDIIVNGLGSAVIAALTYQHIVSGRKDNIVGILTKRFMDLNPVFDERNKNAGE